MVAYGLGRSGLSATSLRNIAPGKPAFPIKANSSLTSTNPVLSKFFADAVWKQAVNDIGDVWQRNFSSITQQPVQIRFLVFQEGNGATFSLDKPALIALYPSLDDSNFSFVKSSFIIEYKPGNRSFNFIPLGKNNTTVAQLIYNNRNLSTTPLFGYAADKLQNELFPHTHKNELRAGIKARDLQNRLQKSDQKFRFYQEKRAFDFNS